MKKYVLSVSGCPSQVDAFSFFLSQLLQEFSDDIMRHAAARGFKRILLCEPVLQDHIAERLTRMHPLSPIEYVWMGKDVKDQSPIDPSHTYVMYGLIESPAEIQ